MNVSQLQPACEIAKVYGVKTLCYGAPGTGKTPIMLTAPNPVILATEPGLLSIRNSKVPVWVGDTWPRILEFKNWLTGSDEPRRYFQTVCMDSGSQAAEISLKAHQATERDGRRAYMKMSQDIMSFFDSLFFMQGMHVFITCKEGNYEDSGVTKFRPFFPGQDLYVKTPHLYDEIFRIENTTIGGKATRAFRTREGYNCIARDRIGFLNEFEPTDLTYVINKCLQ